jgi:hypothetical protein
MKRALFLMGTLTVAAAELPVREVVLYKHGVGFFSRSGDLGRGESARLDFKPSEMNDVLKSLTIEDASGKVVGLRYDSSEPLAKKLGEYPFRLGDSLSLAAFLDQLKGARIELKFGTETIAGAIVSARLLPGTDRQTDKEQILVLADSGDLRTLDLSAMTAVRLQDPALQLQLKEYLAAVAVGRSRDKRSVYIDSSDAGARRVAASYMIPTPVWKSSYRLIYREQAEPMLEGWAIVDNTTGEDWTKVRLALVSGRPISFISQLYEPRYRERPSAELAEDRAQAPVVHAEALEMPRPAAAPAPANRRFGALGGFAGAQQAAAADEVQSRKEVASTVAVNTESRELGDLFEYRFAQPVTVKKNESAMLPFLQQKLTSRKLLIFSERGSQHPTNAAELTNSTGKTLDGGPITVYDAGAYAGEALMETLKAGDKRLISYAVDLGTRVTTNIDSTRDLVREIHFRRGVLTTRNAVQETRTYTIRNVDNKAKTLIIEHPLRTPFKLINQKPAETTATSYRFEVKLAAGATERFPVTEENVYDTSYAISNLTPDVLLTYVQNKNLSDAGRRQLEQIVAKKREIAAADNAVRQNEQTITEMVRDQERIRQNMASLSRVSGQQDQVQKYARELATQESQLATLRDESAGHRKRKLALETELNGLIEKMEF